MEKNYNYNFEQRAPQQHPEVTFDNIGVTECKKSVLDEKLNKISNGKLYHTTDTNEFFYDWNGIRYKLDLFTSASIEDANAAAEKATAAAEKAERVANDAAEVAEEVRTLISGIKTIESFVEISNGYELTLSDGSKLILSNGEKGEKGDDGKSAYEIAVEKGFNGTEDAWLASLKGETGKSAFDIARDNMYVGSVEDWLNSLKGENGEDGLSAYEIALAKGFEGDESAWLASLKGVDGQDGADGLDGVDGATPTIDPDTKHWIINGTDTGVVAEGKDGDGGESALKVTDIVDNIESDASDKPISARAVAVDMVNYIDGIATMAQTYIDEKIEKIAAKNITYSELVSLRDNDDLVPGKLYRITDYQCTTTDTHTASAGHQFDIIVVASDESHLNENAYAAQHSDDTYFANSNLDAWELKYSLDNNNDRFTWANNGVAVRLILNDVFYDRYPSEDDTSFVYGLCWKNENNDKLYSSVENPELDDMRVSLNSPSNTFNKHITDTLTTPVGKGVIYYMKDEFGNECSYDFKNIQFYRKYNTLHYPTVIAEKGDEGAILRYTFYNGDGDASIYNYTDFSTFHNIIKPYTDEHGNYILNNNIIGSRNYYCEFDINCYNNTAEPGAYRIKLKDGCYNNVFAAGAFETELGRQCHDNMIYSGANYNKLGNFCSNNTLSGGAANCTLGNGCSENTVSSGASNCTLGNNCSNNTINSSSSNCTLGNECSRNTIQNSSSSCTLGDNCSRNTIQNGSSSCTLGNNCSGNKIDTSSRCSLGDNCSDNTIQFNAPNCTLGNYCRNNTIQNGSNKNILGDNCNNNTLDSASINNKFADNCSYIVLDGNAAYNTFGNNCSYINFISEISSDDTKVAGGRYHFNKFEDNVSYIDVLNEDTELTSNVQNYVFKSSIKGTSSEQLVINVERGREYNTIVGKNSSGEIKQYCIEDVIV